MDDDQAQSARGSYNRMSRIYGWLSDSSERRFVAEAVEGLLRPEPGEVLLEPGFGAGQVLVALAELVGESGRVYGIDISDGMVEQARHRLHRHGLLDRVDLRVGNVSTLPYPDAFFDGAFMSFTLELFDDQEIPVVLAEMARVLQPSGRLCVACMSTRDGASAMERLYAWSHDRFPSFVDCRPIDAGPWITGAGFVVAEQRSTSMWGLAVDLILARPA